MYFPAVQGCPDLFLQLGEVELRLPVEVDQFSIGIIDDFDGGGCFSKENCRAAAKRLDVGAMLGNQRENNRDKLLLATVIG